MKLFFLLTLAVTVAALSGYTQVSISADGSSPAGSAMLDIQSVSRGFLPPRMSTAQRNAIPAPAEGLVIYNTDLGCIEFYGGESAGWHCPCISPSSADCETLRVNGEYVEGQTLGTTNTVTLEVEACTPGGYSLATSAVNGYRFSARGTFATAGTHTVTLIGSGTPVSAGSDFFLLSGMGISCPFTVDVQSAPTPEYFRSGMFLHHSTGGCIWGPNGSATSVPIEMNAYNTAHGYSGDAVVTMDETWWSPSDNEWVTQHAFFENPDPNTGIGYWLPWNRIMVIKTCFPASAMTGWGQPSDTTSPWMKTVYNYKWHWRHIVAAMASHPDNFFAIWTNAPLEQYSTNPSEALLSKKFCTWAKDTLAAGLDPVFGAFPPNVYVFDFFSKLTGPDGIMLPGYAAGHYDSHPNAAATQLVAPQFVQEIFDAAIAYEAVAPIMRKRKIE